MKKIFYILSIILISIATAKAQWEWQNPLPQGNNLEQVLFVDDNNGWILTKAGTLIRTTDGGISWNEEIIGKLWSQRMHFIDKYNGWCVGSGAPPFIMRTKDGGKSWFDLPIPSERNDGSYFNLWDVFFIDALKGYFVDSRGSIFHTPDGGQSWIKQFQNIPHRDLKSIYFINTLKGFSVGYDAIKRTENGGKLWYADSSVVLPFGDDPREIQFIDNMHGWIMSTNSIFRTINGGDTWANFMIDSNWTQNRNTLAMIFIDSKTGWISSQLGLYQSVDSGKTWLKINSKKLFHGLQFFNLIDGWGTADYEHFFTSDGGVTWVTTSTSITEQTLYGLDFLDENRGWAAGYAGEIIHTTDGGSTWQKQNSGTPNRLKNVEFWDKNIGWIVGWRGVTLRTINGGDVWENHTVNSDYFLETTSFVSPQEGWTAGWNWTEDIGVILHTTNGGQSWIDQSPPNAGRFYGVYFIDSQNGWVASGGGTVFDRGEVYRTTNGGNTWSLQIYEPDDAFNKIIFVDSLTGWITSDIGLLKTTNGGELWERKPAAMEFVYDIHFLDTLRGWASGFEGSFSLTTNGGETWIKKQLQTYSSLIAIDFANENFGWVAGDFGTLLNTTDGGVTDINNDQVYTYPHNFILYQNYPNPFNPITKIKFKIPTSSVVTLKIYDVLGREVETLFNEYKAAGIYEIEFDGSEYASGIYFYKLTSGQFTSVKKLILMK